ncbi:MAG TPA: DsbA family protein [Acidimicrobiia bacterium]|nr:DsbA family protein [Acidimicrobiia bacterium]
MAREFAISFDYRCPFARNAHESVVTGLREGRDWNVTFTPFSLDQVHVEEGEPPVWERDPAVWGTGVNALLWGIAVRDAFPDKFLDWHLAAFSARHDEGQKIAKVEVLRDIAESVGLDVDAVAKEADSGRPLETLAQTHTESVKRHSMFGVPTFVQGDQAVFVRFMTRKEPTDIDRALDLLEWPDLNEFKHTSVAR